MADIHTFETGKSTQSALESQFIRDFLRNHGYSKEAIQNLPVQKRQDLLRSACQYASLKLAEIESCSKFVQKLHVST